MLSWVLATASAADWLLLVAAVVFLLYLYGTWTFATFRQRGLPQVSGALPFVGHIFPMMTGKFSVPEFFLDLCSRIGTEGMIGFFWFRTPALLIRDPELVKIVAIKEFDTFSDHLPFISEKINPILGRGLFSLSGHAWREMRATLSPTFTSSKVRNIVKLIDVCGENTTKYIQKEIDSSPDKMFEAEMKNFFTRFTNDCIATSGFGIQCDSLNDPDNEFYALGRELTNTAGLRSFYFFLHMMCPRLAEFLKLAVIPDSLVQQVHSIVVDTMKERQEKGIYRPDVLQLLMEARDGKLKVAKEDEHEAEDLKVEKRQLTDEDVTAQAAGFFFGGFETVATLMSFTSVALAQHPDVQQRLQQEIDEVLEARDGAVTYESIQDMKYLDMVINETLRKHSGMGLGRVCVKDSFTFPARGERPEYTVRKGEIVLVPAHAIHYDPQYWPDPQRFDPERFNDENKPNIRPFTFMPFGSGPRICIGMRLALIETKVVLVHILKKFNFKTIPKTPKEPTFAKPDFAIGIQRNCWLGIVPRDD